MIRCSLGDQVISQCLGRGWQYLENAVSENVILDSLDDRCPSFLWTMTEQALNGVARTSSTEFDTNEIPMRSCYKTYCNIEDRKRLGRGGILARETKASG